MRELFFSVQFVVIFCLFIECWFIFKNLRKPIHSYLLMSSMCALLNNLGYLLQITSKTPEGILNSVKFSYLGKTFYTFFIFLFALEFVRVRVNEILKRILMLVHIGLYGAVLIVEQHSLYYKDIVYITDSSFSRIEHGNGILHHLFMAMNIVYIVVGITLLLNAYGNEKSKKVKHRILVVLIAVMTETFFFALQVFGINKITNGYDVMTVGYFIGTIFMLIAIISFDLLGTGEIAKEFIVDRISEGIVAVDNEGIIKYVNEPALKLYPELNPEKDLFTEVLTTENADKKDENEVVETPGPDRVLRSLKQAVDNNENIEINGRLYKPEENRLIHKGEIFGTLYALKDETEHIRYMEMLERQRTVADRANVAKSRFLANMSHEIRTPINAVLGMDEMIIRETEDETIRSYANDIMAAGKTLLSLINDILDFSKVEEGKIQILPVQYELSSMINDVVNMIKERALKKGLRFEVKVDEHIPHLLIGDEIRVRQCVMNILTNAVKYTEKGSVNFTVSFKKKFSGGEGRKPVISLGFAVEDTGIGIRKEEMEKLFSPYERIEEKRNRTIEGTGLGMSITRQLLDLMGSKLEVQTEYGKGSCFSFEVDQEVASENEIGDYAKRYGAARTGSRTYCELFHAPSARILVVDDTEINLTVFRGLLKRTLVKIDTASSGEEALVLAAKNRYDVVYIDHMMPYMDGIETLEAMRKEGKNISTPAVALTANAVSGAREMYLAAGFTEYLSKPIDGTRLERMLLELLPPEKVKKEGEEFSPEEEKKEEETENLQLPAWIFKVPEINAEAGLTNCGSAEGYLSVLEVFHRTAKDKAEEILKLYRENDIKNYTIKVHALKSSARIIGAAELSALAEKLEKAGKEENMDFISENNEKLLSGYHELDEHLKEFDAKDRPLPEIEPEALKDAYQTILEVARTMDYGLMDSLLKSLRDYRLKPEDDKMVSRIEKLLTELDWDGIVLAMGEVEEIKS
ncbi:MAG: response regulator [Lachnospiraceae bacterium]|nr:response regulator [Lachnospiraceae bacterium]